MNVRTGDSMRWARIRWHLTNPLLRLCVQTALVGGLAVAGFAVLRIGDSINETAASVLVAVMFGVGTLLQNRQAQRRQHTVNLLTILHNESVSAADVWMAERIAARRAVKVDIPVEDLAHVITILDYYEFLSSLAVRGFVDIPLLLNLRGGTMSRCFELCRSYITDRRAEVGDELYRSFEALVREYARHFGVTPPPAPIGLPDRASPPGAASGKLGR